MFAYLLLLTALFQDVCLHNACSFLFVYYAVEFRIVIVHAIFSFFHALSLGY